MVDINIGILEDNTQIHKSFGFQIFYLTSSFNFFTNKDIYKILQAEQKDRYEVEKELITMKINSFEVCWSHQPQVPLVTEYYNNFGDESEFDKYFKIVDFSGQKNELKLKIESYFSYLEHCNQDCTNISNIKDNVIRNLLIRNIMLVYQNLLDYKLDIELFDSMCKDMDLQSTSVQTKDEIYSCMDSIKNDYEIVIDKCFVDKSKAVSETNKNLINYVDLSYRIIADFKLKEFTRTKKAILEDFDQYFDQGFKYSKQYTQNELDSNYTGSCVDRISCNKSYVFNKYKMEVVNQMLDEISNKMDWELVVEYCQGWGQGQAHDAWKVDLINEVIKGFKDC